MIDDILVTAIAVYVAYAIVGIVMVRLNVRWLDPARIARAPIDDLYAERPALRDAVARLAPLGFLPVAGARVDQGPTDPRMIILKRQGEPAIAAVTSFRKTLRTLIVTEFCQGDAVACSRCVNDSPVPRVEPPLACSRGVRLPGSTPEALWRAFNHIRDHEQADGRWRAPQSGDEVEVLRRHCERQVAELRERGLLSMNIEGPPRLTVRAAVQFTLKLLWPFKYAVNYAQIARSRRAAGLA
jgi:hypothetical protein